MRLPRAESVSSTPSCTVGEHGFKFGSSPCICTQKKQRLGLTRAEHLFHNQAVYIFKNKQSTIYKQAKQSSIAVGAASGGVVAVHL